MDVHSVSLQGKREQNEDKHSVILNIEGKNSKISKINFFGVYDGHGGKFVSGFLEKNIPYWFTDKRVAYPLSNKYIHGVYKKLQDTLINKYNKYATHCGSTCMTAAHYKNENKEYFHVMNCGDCRTVLCRDNIAIPLTLDHKPNWPIEKRRINNLGGQIYSDGTDYRVKDLSVSRAFGDIDAHPYLTNVPDIFKYKIEKTDKFIIMACDGVWDVLTNCDAVNFILNECYDDALEIRINRSVNMARKLAEHALLKGSTDNLTVIVIFLK